MHTRNFFGFSLINPFEHHGVGSLTLTRTPPLHINLGSLSSFRYCYPMYRHLNGLYVFINLEMNRWAKLTKVIKSVSILLHSSSICNRPGGGSWRFDGTLIGGEGEGGGLHGVAGVSGFAEGDYRSQSLLNQKLVL